MPPEVQLFEDDFLEQQAMAFERFIIGVMLQLDELESMVRGFPSQPYCDELLERIDRYRGDFLALYERYAAIRNDDGSGEEHGLAGLAVVSTWSGSSTEEDEYEQVEGCDEEDSHKQVTTQLPKPDKVPSLLEESVEELGKGKEEMCPTSMISDSHHIPGYDPSLAALFMQSTYLDGGG